MNLLSTFFGEFWWMFLLASAFWGLLQWGRRVSLDGGAAVFVRPGSFRELSGLPVSEQKRLLHVADREAYSGWRFFLPTLNYAAVFAGGIAMARALPFSFAVSMGLAMCCIVLCCWAARRLEERHIRPFLQVEMERRNDG